ncbi:MAG: FAD-binding protein [Sedimentisphaerales bacterium]|nr:FAD-binding protein [Sedimentisphaerales bacterium]
MSNFIVLVKQVPDVSQITDNAFDPSTGTLIRARLASVINELDTQAMAFANRMRNLNGDADSKIVALSMGPPMAEDVLRYALSRCADTVILLTDKALGGADTVATANPLAFSIRKIVKEIFNGDNNYFVVSGMQSVDGDTAQVPPQIAEELGLPCIAYATDCRLNNGRFEFTRIISGGSQIVAAKRPPAVVTVAKYEYPLFATFAASRRAGKTKVITWSAADINATLIGTKGSKTWVIRVFPPGKTNRKCRCLTDAKSLADVIIESVKSQKSGDESDKQISGYILPSKRKDHFDRTFEGTAKEVEDYKILTNKLRELGITAISSIDESIKEKILAAAGENFHKNTLDDMLAGLQVAEPSYKGEVWVVAEHRDNIIHPATFELIGKARDLADSLETKVGVVIAGHKLPPLTQSLIAAGADNVYLIDDPLLGEFDPLSHRKVIADAVSKYRPQIVLYAATPQGRVLAPLISYRVGCGLTADCTSFDIRDSSRKGQFAVLLQTRPALGGNVMATISTKNSRSQMATARPGVMKRLPPDLSRKGKVINHKASVTQDDISLEIIKTERGAGKVQFDAEVIVSGGKGMQNRDNYEKLLNSLRDALKNRLNVPVERGASRAAVEQGFAERIRQVGQTGTAVGPKLYLAIGISGAIQHMIGVANTETIIAINSDHNAPIFKQCDYYVVGNAEDVIPQLAAALQEHT